MNEEPLMTQAEVAALLQVKPATINTWVMQQKIPFVKLNGVVRFDRKEIAAWMNARKQAAQGTGRSVVLK